MSKPVVAIVGRPNVGKSTLFNVLAGEKISIVKDTPGVTRDRIYADTSWLDRDFTLIDTGGIEPESKDIIISQMREQAQIAIDTADVIVFITDVRQGLVDADSKVADMLRRSGKPVVLVVNKVDSFQKFMADVYEFYNLGIGDPHPISASSRLGIGDMLDAVIKYFPKHTGEEEEDERPRVAIVGKPNVGKSSIINKLVGEDRVIVSDIAGTTRDVLEEHINLQGISLNIMDTAGIRDTEDIVEKIGVDKAINYAKDADLILFVIDASSELDENDIEILKMIQGKQAIILLNKSDLDMIVTKKVIENKVNELQPVNSSETENHNPIIEVSAKEKSGIAEFEQILKDMFYDGKLTFNDEIYITNVRQKTALQEAYRSLQKVNESIEMGMPEDFYSIDLLDAYESLGSITGETIGEDLVNEIFSKFCMGK